MGAGKHIPHTEANATVRNASREELIVRLLAATESSSFQFTAAWLNKQWTRRLRSLLLATQRQDRALEQGAF